MRFVADAGLWTTGAVPAPIPLTAVLEITGAVLSWTVDEPDSGVHIAFTDVDRADWLWRVVGERGHSWVLTALGSAAGAAVEVPDVVFDDSACAPLRRLAVGHWLRRWWPASSRDGIVDLDRALLDGELALLTARAEPFLADDTVDSDLAELLRPHVGALDALARQGDPRAQDLATACAELAAEVGVPPAETADAVANAAVSRDQFALAAGAGRVGPGGVTVASGVDSVAWAAVPPGVFDAAEDTIGWRIEVEGATARAVVRVELAGTGSAGIVVYIDSGAIAGSGVLDDAGEATVDLVEQSGSPASEDAAWNHDWRDTVVRLGTASAEAVESRQQRDRVRAFARQRLRRPAADAYLAEVLAAESDY